MARGSRWFRPQTRAARENCARMVAVLPTAGLTSWADPLSQQLGYATGAVVPCAPIRAQATPTTADQLSVATASLHSHESCAPTG
jgi:hypothetical protein